MLELNPCLLAKYLRIYNLWGISANIYEKNVDSSLLILSQTLQRMHNYQTKNSNRNFLRIVMALNNYGILGLKHTLRKSIHNCISKLRILGEKIDLLLFTVKYILCLQFENYCKVGFHRQCNGLNYLLTLGLILFHDNYPFNFCALIFHDRNAFKI